MVKYQETSECSGHLNIFNGKLQFIPFVYPSTQVRALGFVWKGKDKGWISDLNRPAIIELLKIFPDVELRDDLCEWISEKKDIQRTVMEYGRRSNEVFPYQSEAVLFALESKRSLIALAPGLGKTICGAIAAQNTEVERVLVICPLTLVPNWIREIDSWTGESCTFWHGKVDGWESYDKFVVTNYATASRNMDDIMAQDFQAIIIDESILVKNRTAKRTKALKQICKGVEYVWMLSGGPVAKFLDDMWSQLNILYPRRFSSYWRFVEQYCVIETNHWGTKVVGDQPGAHERLKSLISDIYFARTQDEVLDLPDWIFDTYDIPMSKKQYRYYDEMERTFLAQLPDGDEVLAPIILVQILRLVQFASNPTLLGGEDVGAKWDAVKDLFNYEQLPAIIWITFVETAQLLHAKLTDAGFTVAILNGSVPSLERQQIVDDFQGGKIDIILAHPAVGKFGLTLTRARTAIYLERSYNRDDYYQSLFRVRRIGTTHSPHVIHLLSTTPNGGKTVDHVIDRVLDYSARSNIRITTNMIREELGK